VRAYVNALQAVAPGSGRTLLVSPPDPGAGPPPDPGAGPPPEPAAAAPTGSRALLVLMCVLAFLACFSGALVVTQQLH
jgi:hypothetical protein